MGNALNLQEINQEEAQNLLRFFLRTGQNIFIFGRRGTGKMLDLETELPTPKGFIKLKDLREGDQLFDECGNVCSIVRLHPIDAAPKSYRVVFDDGTTINACADHLWLTWDKRARKNKTTSPQVRTTEEIRQTLKTTTYAKPETNHSIPCCKPLSYFEQPLPIDPYVLGCWLGDGHSDRGTLECADLEILEQINTAGYSTTQRPSSVGRSKSSAYRIGDIILNDCDRHRGIGILTKQLQDLGLIHNKHIPSQYLIASYSQRLALLQGLMDTDGCCDKRGSLEYCSTLPELAEQVLLLIKSLGIKASIHQAESWLYDKRCADRYRIDFRTQLPVFRLPRKLDRIRQDKQQLTRTTHRYIVDVQSIGPISMRCLEVDSPSHLFLITRSFIPTHNTDLAMQAAKDCGFGITYLNLSVIERPDLAGYPILNDGYDVVSFKQPHYLAPLKEGEKPSKVLLLDEIDKASSDITAPLLEILQFKTINGKKLDIAGIVATGNLQAENAGSNLISTALLDRASKYQLQFNFQLWLTWAQTHGIHDLILGFLTTHPDLACGEVEATCEYATPSPRGWTLASDAIHQAMKLKLVDVETITGIVAGYVGASAAHKWSVWFQWFRRWEPTIRSMLESGNCTLDYKALTPTEQLVFVISACHLAKVRFVQESKTKPKYRVVENLCAFLKENAEPEYQTIGLGNSFPIELVIDKRYRLIECQPFFSLHSQITDLRNKR